MTSNAIVTMSSIGEGYIDKDRIVNSELVPDEYFCPICKYLLWKPRSCSTCQHLFCEKCIKTWIEFTNNDKRCPFRCKPFEDRRCPPFIQSLLSYLNIQCRNSEFGCEQILPYDQLEHHENVECQYLTQRCSECNKLVPLSEFVEHEETPGLCIPCPIECTICENYIEKCYFREHFSECCQERNNELIEIVSRRRNLERFITGQPITPDYEIRFFQSITNKIELVERQKQMSRLPTTIKGINSIRRGRGENSGHFYHILMILKIYLLNWYNAPFFILMSSLGGFLAIIILILCGYVIFTSWRNKHSYFGPFIIILLSYLLNNGISIVFKYLSDKAIMFFFGLIIFLCGCTSRASLELHEMNYLFNKPIVNIILGCICLFITKLILLLIRLYYSLIPKYIGEIILIFINFYLSYNAYRIHEFALRGITN